MYILRFIFNKSDLRSRKSFKSFKLNKLNKMSIAQLLEQYSEDNLIETYNYIMNIQSRAEWLDLHDDLKYKGYIAIYYNYNKEKETACFNNFIQAVHTKLLFVSNDNEYSEGCPNVSINTFENLNNIKVQVETGEKTWLQGLKDLYTLEDMEIYGI